MKTLLTILGIVLYFSSFGQIKEKAIIEYKESELYRFHSSMAFSIEKNIREEKLDEIKKNFPADKNWNTANDKFIRDLEKSVKYFPECKPLDTTLSIGINPLETESYKTTIIFYYKCKSKAPDFEYVITMTFYWTGHETKGFEMTFKESEDRKKLENLILETTPKK